MDRQHLRQAFLPDIFFFYWCFANFSIFYIFDMVSTFLMGYTCKLHRITRYIAIYGNIDISINPIFGSTVADIFTVSIDRYLYIWSSFGLFSLSIFLC